MIHDKDYLKIKFSITCDLCTKDFDSVEGDEKSDFVKQANEAGFRIVETNNMICLACPDCIPNIEEDDTL
jgi:hypothetical protein